MLAVTLALLCLCATLNVDPALAETWVVTNLHPEWAASSIAYGISNGQQVGITGLFGGSYYHAALWSGAAASWVDLNPVGATESWAYGVSNGQQAGYAYIGSYYHAGLWSGTAASWVDLNPAGASNSVAHGVSNGRQAGYATIGSSDHAGLWSGTAESWVDLHALLPSGVYSDSYAEAVYSSAETIQVVGRAYNKALNRNEAIMWSMVPEPCTILSFGALSALGLARIALRRRRG